MKRPYLRVTDRTVIIVVLLSWWIGGRAGSGGDGGEGGGAGSMGGRGGEGRLESEGSPGLELLVTKCHCW